MTQPEISIGILSAGEICVKNNPGNNSFIIKNVVFGKEFHWERREDQEFRGELKIIRENGLLTAVNVIPIEEYLESVISSEMSAASSLEFLKAHAVISRSWLMAQIEKSKSPDKGKHASITETETEYIRWWDREDHENFDVCADDHCQRYQGIARVSSPCVKEAVQATFGEFLTYEGRICDTRFYKCCGGRTENFESCWEPEPHSYLTSIVDTDADGSVFCDTKDSAVLAQFLNDYDLETTDFYRWQVTYSQEEISNLIKRKTGWDFGQIIDLQPVEIGASGRIVRLKIIGTKLVKTIGKELFIRKALSESHLYSSAFTVGKKFADADRSGIPSEFTLHGSGWGHGVGLCQTGAAVMAAKGFNYKQILEHYFPGSKLEKLY
ncbi:MAG: SpoIID/LytB domain-containing protein [Dysgonamonadaceae bacterium]|jgi:SpoIID/LytB domain protein|nr:SpoIID/LytB domain-containing protein [Dysgonamonadaceae bacterium]